MNKDILYNPFFFIITGGPGVGKTTVLTALEKEGYAMVPEVARKIIREQVEKNGKGLPWKDRKLYTGLMLEQSRESFLAIHAAPVSGPVFFDRGLLDSICYAQLAGIGVTEKMKAYAERYRYNPMVFMLPPWKEIYVTDTERKQDWQEALETYEMMKYTYKMFSYKITEVPKDTIENRKDFILEKIKQNEK